MRSESPSRRVRVVEYDPRRPWRIGVAIGLLWLVSLLGIYLYVRASVVPQYANATTELASARSELAVARAQIEELQRRVAQHERGEQVAERATQELQTALAARQEELASLRNDLSFYQRLMEGGAQQPGISVHSLALRETDQPGTFQYALTLSQNLKRNRQAEGKVEITVSGSGAQGNVRLGLTDLGSANADLDFSFKYFQQLAGLFMLPDGFRPSTVKVRVSPAGGGVIEREFVWKDIVSQGDT
ncbi:MAG: DUF6776 family protein [Lysobacterales bacterium]